MTVHLKILNDCLLITISPFSCYLKLILPIAPAIYFKRRLDTHSAGIFTYLTLSSEVALVLWSSESLGYILTGEDTDHAKSPKDLYVGV
jgi:hypothetical protein